MSLSYLDTGRFDAREIRRGHAEERAAVTIANNAIQVASARALIEAERSFWNAFRSQATTSAERSKADNELAYLDQLERETIERLDAGPYARPATWE